MTQRLNGIQYLRAVAALAVVAYHAGLRSGFDFSIGGARVDIFFVISGFMMWTITANRPPDPWRFLVRRFLRLVPLYWAVTLGIFTIAAVTPWLMPQMDTDWGRLILSLLFIPHLDRRGAPFPVLAPGWSLNYEAFFYIVFAALMLLPRRCWLTVLSLLLTGLAAASIVIEPTRTFAIVYTNPLLLEFLAGVWLGWLWQRNLMPSPAVGLTLICSGFAMLVPVYFLGLSEGTQRVLSWGIPAAAIVAGALAIEAAGRMPVWPGLARLGDASYAIYLLHGPLVGLLWRLTGQASVTFHLLVSLVASSCLGLLALYYFERPVAAAIREAGIARG